MKKVHAWKHRILSILIILSGLIAFRISPIYPVLKSYLVMSVYSHMHEKNSFLEKLNIDVQIPGGLSTPNKDYYPFVICYDSGEDYSERIHEEVELVIYYNFPAMDLSQGASLLYKENSPLCNSFYGAYALQFKNQDKIFGRKTDGLPDYESIMDVTRFDLEELVLESVGAVNPKVDYELESVEETIVFDGKEFQILEAQLECEGLWHEVKKDYLAYIQYGRPTSKMGAGTSFKRIKMYGRIYMYIDEVTKISYFYYALATTKEQIEDIERKFIITSKIS